jgi:hypothetical protein
LTKNEIIARQSRLIVELIKMGTEKMQEVADLFSAIEREREEIKAEPKPKRKGGWPKGKPRRKDHENQ